MGLCNYDTRTHTHTYTHTHTHSHAHTHTCPVIEGDYAVCMQHLMQFPTVYEVNYLVQRSLHLRNPVSAHSPGSCRPTLPSPLSSPVDCLRSTTHLVLPPQPRDSHPLSSSPTCSHTEQPRSRSTVTGKQGQPSVSISSHLSILISTAGKACADYHSQATPTCPGSAQGDHTTSTSRCIGT